MTSLSYIIAAKIAVVAIAVSAVSVSAGTKIAVLTPDNTESSRKFGDALSQNFEATIFGVDADMAASAYDAQPPGDPFNMTTVEARRVGTAIGCRFLVVTRAAVQRRSSSARPVYFEAYAVIYLVSSRTGHLSDWSLRKFEAATASDAERQLIDAAGLVATDISRQAELTAGKEAREQPVGEMEEPPDGTSPLARAFKAPVPFRRIKPAYTEIAAFYEVSAIVDITVDLDAAGEVLRTEITRWAGFGLDESVERVVRQMNWRPAERSGKFIPMRFLLRYNFKKTAKD